MTVLGFSLGTPDGIYGSHTMEAIRDFQAAALDSVRLVNSQAVNVTPSFQGVEDGECNRETRQEIKHWLENSYKVPTLSVPAWKAAEEPQKVQGVPFAEPTSAAKFWPVITKDRGGREVAYLSKSGKSYGRSGRRFLAERSGGRYHVGVDLWANDGDIIVACEDGIIVNHYLFYHGVYALFEECDSGLVINYGEVRADSWLEFKVDKGTRVVAGQPIARVGHMTNSSMCHFEMYVKGTRENYRYYKSDSPPRQLYNPTKYLIYLAELGSNQNQTNTVTQARLPAPETPPAQNNIAKPTLLDFHNVFGGVRWKLTDKGIDIENTGIERTAGDPKTITRIWEEFGDSINQWATFYNVPCVLIVATIATETGGKAHKVREEPHYESDNETPNKVSPGLMQTLISTARETLQDNSIDRNWLLIPDNSIKAGTAYIAKKHSETLFDPPKVACVYNAGSLKENTSRNNRWKMRQYPIGTSEHCDRFVKWFNDAVFVLNTHSKKPSVPYEQYFS